MIFEPGASQRVGSSMPVASDAHRSLSRSNGIASERKVNRCRRFTANPSYLTLAIGWQAQNLTGPVEFEDPHIFVTVLLQCVTFECVRCYQSGSPPARGNYFG